MLSNKDCYKRNKSFTGNFKEWFNLCVDENDLFRVWFKELPEDADCDYCYIVNVIDIPGDYILGLSTYDNNIGKDKMTISYYRLSDISSFALVPNEEDYN